jgi:hypothetical protein
MAEKRITETAVGQRVSSGFFVAREDRPAFHEILDNAGRGWQHLPACRG